MTYTSPKMREAQIYRLLPLTGDGMKTNEIAKKLGFHKESTRVHLRHLESLNRAHVAHKVGIGQAEIWMRGPKPGVLPFECEPDATPEAEIGEIVTRGADEPKQSVLKSYAPMQVADHMRALPVAFFRSGVAA